MITFMASNDRTSRPGVVEMYVRSSKRTFRPTQKIVSAMLI